jgi:hypothetical protein
MTLAGWMYMTGWFVGMLSGAWLFVWGADLPLGLRILGVVAIFLGTLHGALKLRT